MKTRVRGLTELRRLYQIESGYIDMKGNRQNADSEATLHVLRALGADLGGGDDVDRAVHARRHELAHVAVQPVHVAWNGSLSRIHVRLPHDVPENVAIEVRLESGEIVRDFVIAEPARMRSRNGWRPTHTLPLQRRLPLGYHTISIEARTGTLESFVIAAPRRAFADDDVAQWGVFLPLYALCSSRNWGIGDYTDLREAALWAGSLGASFIGTLPLLATFLETPFEPSPYSPASRLFWNELFVDITAVPGFAAASHVPHETELAACRTGDLVDYRRVAALKRRALEDVMRTATADADVAAAFTAWTRAHPRAEDYARFRAVGDRQRAGWGAWPERLRSGDITPRDFAREDHDYHLFAQWQADQQLNRVATAHAAGAARLYLDMPLGVNNDSYDVWRFPDLFVEDIAAGAPPDPLFTGGQSWGFRPLHPAALRARRYAYFIETLRHHLRVARMVRLDHVMSLYRLFWVPAGMEATRGVYVRYPEDELFAVLVLESARHQAVVIGEDLGTVPHAVRRAMQKHHVQRMHVVQFEASPLNEMPVPEPPRDAVASLNTHDMPTFAGFWRGTDIDDQLDLGLIDPAEHVIAHDNRALLREHLATLAHAGSSAAVAGVRDGLLEHLAASPARYVLVTLEDLWLEERPQNVPDTSSERPNWQRRARRSLPDIIGSNDVTRSLLRVEAQRQPLRTEPDHG